MVNLSFVMNETKDYFYNDALHRGFGFENPNKAAVLLFVCRRFSRRSRPSPKYLQSGSNQKTQKTKKDKPRMKTTITMLLAFAAVSVNLHAVNQAPPAPLPDFMDKAQMAKWNADQAPGQTASPSSATQFYTGKPYVEEAGGYIFRFRTYNPESSSWTASDPMGFPDGANNRSYAPVPTTAFDKLGLYSSADAIYDRGLVQGAIYYWAAAGYYGSVNHAYQALNYGGNMTATSGEIAAMKSDSGFTDVFNQAYFQDIANESGNTGDPTYNKNETLAFSGGDLYYSFGHVVFNATGTLSWDANNKWSTTATFTFTDLYDFNPASSNPAIAAFNRLQENNYAGYYSTSTSFTVDYSE
jgi:RHS repeat-associated protein